MLQDFVYFHSMSTFGQTVLIESAQILLNFCSEYFCNFINIKNRAKKEGKKHRTVLEYKIELEFVQVRTNRFTSTQSKWYEDKKIG